MLSIIKVFMKILEVYISQSLKRSLLLKSLISKLHKKKNIMQSNEDNWELVISARSSLFDLRLKEVWHYRDLLALFVRRDFVTVYKQTILGPLWFFIQPLLTTLTFTVIFGNVAGLSTEGAPKMAFYLTGITLWNYFSTCMTAVSGVFATNANIFGKVYFPRLIMPLTIVISNLMKFGVQFLLLGGFVVYFTIIGSVHPNSWILLTPFVVLLMAAIALGIGMVLSAMTTKYRDLNQLIAFGVQLLMYATPVIYASSSIPKDYQWISKVNPLSSLFDYMRYAFLGVGTFTYTDLIYPSLFAIGVVILGTVVFNKVQRTFMDTV